MPYTVRFSPAARRGLRRLSREAQQRLAPFLDALEADARPHGATAMVGQAASTYRIRIGDYRIVYRVDDAQQLILVTVIGHRKDVYRDL